NAERFQQSDQLRRLPQIRRLWILRIDTERPFIRSGVGPRCAAAVTAFRVRHKIADIYARRQHHVFADFAAYSSDYIAHQPRTIFERTTIFSRTLVRRQKLIQQIAVALLDVDEIEPEFNDALRSLDIRVFDAH